MVAIFTGAGTGFERGSGSVLGSSGLLGSAGLGRSGEQVFLNAANGNLLINRQDEFLVGRGPDAGAGRTYNSLGNQSDDNGDNWLQSTDRRVFGLTGTANSWGSTVKRRSADGSEITYRWDGTSYVATDGAGSFDRLSYNGTNWIWTDGDSRVTESYAAYGSYWRIVSLSDMSGNSLLYGYTGDKLTTLTTANGETLTYTWSGNHITTVDSGDGTLTRYFYDSQDRLSRVDIELTGGGSVYSTSYTYHGSSKLVASIGETDGSYVAIGYDGSNRVISLAQTVAAGDTRTTTIAYGAGYTIVTDPAGQATRLDYAPGNLVADIATWPKSNLAAASATIDGGAATRFEITEGGWAAVYQGEVPVAASDTVTWAVTLQGMGSATAQALGIYSPIDTWGSNGLSSARIVSGPGQLVQDAGGLWSVVGLSTTTGTRIEIMRVAAQADQLSFYLYPDRVGGWRVGEGVIAADATVYKSSTATNPYLSDQGNWAYYDTARQSAGTLHGGAAYQYTIQPNVTWAAVYQALTAERGDSFTYTVTLQGSGDSTATSIGLYGNTTGWGDNSWASACIVSGPGNISQETGGLFNIGGLSTTTPTRIEITRTYDRGETGGIYTYVDRPFGMRVGRSLIMGAPKFTRSISTENANQLTKITTGYGTAQAQTVQFGYNAKGDLTSVADGLGNTTSYTYDANGNQLTATDRLGNVVTRTYGAANQLLTETRTGSDRDSAVAAHTTRYAYDSANRLVYTVSAEGKVTRNWYNGYGQLYFISEFPDHRYDLSGLAANQALSQSQLDDWCAGLGDTSSAVVTYLSYDARGNMIRSMRASASSKYSVYDGMGGERDEHFTYDSAGRLLSRYVLSQNTESFVYDGLGRVVASTDLSGGTTSIVFNDAATQTVVTLGNGLTETSTYNKAGELVSYTKFGPFVTGTAMGYQYDKNGRARIYTDGSGIKTYYLYDKLDRKVADIDSYGGVTEYWYDLNDRVIGTVRYRFGVMGGTGTIAALGDPNNSLDLASIRPRHHDENLWTWTVYDKEGRLIEAIEGDGSVTAYEYDASGRLVKTTGYVNKLSSGQLDAFKVNGPSAWLPAAHAEDSVARVFYDKDGRKIGALDGEGYLTRTIYDGAGRKVREIAYANITSAALRASGSFQSLIDNAGTSASDRSVRYVYDGQNLLRYTIDALGQVTEYGYGSISVAIGLVRLTTRYAGTLGALSSYSYASVKAAVAALASNPANRTGWAVYDNAGRLAYAIDAAGAVVGYSYDTRGQMVRKVEYATLRPTGSLPSLGDMDGWASGTATSGDRITRYYYNATGELRFTVDAEGYITGNDYDGAGRVRFSARWDTRVSANDSWTIHDVYNAVSGQWEGTNSYYDAVGRLSLTTDQAGRSRRYYYYGTGLLGREIVSEGTPDESRIFYTHDLAGRKAAVYAAYGAAEQAITTYAYNGLGDLVQTTDPNGNTTSFEYDHAGRVIRQTNAHGSPTVFEYNAFGEVTRTINARGLSTYSYYDQAGRVTSVVDALNYATTTSYTVFGEVASVTRAGATTSFAYDKLGRVVTTTDAEGGIETSGYDAFGNRIRFVNKLGGVTEYSYNRRGLLAEEKVQAIRDESNNIVTAGFSRNRYEYDARGNVVHRIEAYNLAEQRDTWFSYDKANRLTSKWGEAVSVGLSPATVTPTEYYRYDTRGNLIETIDANGARTFSIYDKLDRKTAEVGPTGAVRTWAYDVVGNVTGERVYASLAKVPATAGALELQVRGMYDLALGRQPTQAEIDNWSWRMANLYPGPNAVASAFAEILGDGNVQSRFPPSSTNAAFIRNVYLFAFRREPMAGEVDIWLGNMANGWSRAQVLAEFTRQPAHIENSAVEMAKQQVAALAGSGNYRETIYAYDNLNRLKTRSVSGQSYGYWSGSSYVYVTGATLETAYEYNVVGDLVRTTDSSGKSVYSYYDANSRKIAQVDQEGYLTRWALDAEGNVLGERRFASRALDVTSSSYTAPQIQGADRLTEFSYDRMGRRTEERRYGVEAWSLNTANGQLSGASGTSLIRYTYNALGEVKTKTEARLEAGGVVQGPAETTTYSYDNAGRLIQEARPGFSGVTPTMRYQYNGLDQLTVTRQGDASPQASDRITTNLYDGAGRLTGTVDALGQTRSYVYDAAGRKLGEYYLRQFGNGSAVDNGSVRFEGISYQYDLAGNVIRQATNWISEGVWSEFSWTQSAYNAFGEVTDRGTNVAAGSAPSGWQEHFVYDAGGRLVRSNAGDGVWRIHGYDQAGRQTLSLESDGATDLSGMAQADAIGRIAGGTVTASATVYDGRGQAIQAVQILRRVSAGGAAQTIATGRGYTAFGELAWETDAYGRRTDYSYNTMGRVTQIERPWVARTTENDRTEEIRPTERMFYDIAGRLIGTQDANSVDTGSNVKTTRQLLAGTGYGDGAALVVREWHPDGGIVNNSYDVFGDRTGAWDELNRYTAMAYDKLGRLTRVTRPGTWAGQLVEEYAYDVLGQRIGQWNNVVGYAGRARTEYDTLGRVTLQVAFGNEYTTTSYAWQDGAQGGPTGWLATTTYINGRDSRERTDLFGRVVWARDLGARETSISYDRAGRMTQRVSGSEVATYSWLNNGKIGEVAIGVDRSAAQANFRLDRTGYAYDLLGNQTQEVLTRSWGEWVDEGFQVDDDRYSYWVPSWQYQTGVATISSQSASYDALGRLAYWSALATAKMPAASTSYAYDANSNIRRSLASFQTLDQYGAPGAAGTQDYWYRYDAMNRVVTAKGIQSGGTIVRGGQGVDIYYDAAGQRTQTVTQITSAITVQYEVYDPGMHSGWGGNQVIQQTVEFEAESRESYSYWGDGTLYNVFVAASGASDNGDGTITVTAPGAASRRATYWYDLQGRLTRQIDWGTDPDYDPNALNTAIYDRLVQYNTKGQVASEEVHQRQGGIAQTTQTSNTYYDGASNYYLGAVVSSQTSVWRTNVAFSTTSVSNNYGWYDGATLLSSTVAGTTTGTTTYSYNGFGQPVSAGIVDGRPRTITYTNDTSGQVIRREETGIGPQEVWYRFGGKQMGYVGNNGTLDTDYQASVASRQLTSGTGGFRNGSSYAQPHADFDQFYNPITSYKQGGAGGSYTVQGGETLASIAAALWGDASLWFRLAEANGLSSGSALVAGQRLTIPTGVARSTYNASTFQPYDPAATLGDTSPTTPTPQAQPRAKQGCGVLGAILIAVVAVAITLLIKAPVSNFFNGLFGVTASTAAGATSAIAAGIATGATVGAAASAGSQIFGLATGIQDKFSWKSVALAGISGGVGGGLGQVPGLDKIAGSSFLGDVTKGVLGNAIGQGIGIAVGLQSKFDFAGLAAAGVSAGVGNALGSAFGGGDTKLGRFAIQTAVRTASAIAGAATRSAIDGTDFGDNIIACRV